MKKSFGRGPLPRKAGTEARGAGAAEALPRPGTNIKITLFFQTLSYIIVAFKKEGVMRNKRFKDEISETFKAVIWAAALAIAVRTFAIEPFHIPSDSMIPNLFVGDHLFVSKISYGYSRQSFPFSLPLVKNRILFTKPKRGDVVVFRKIKGKPDNYIKRLIGMPGDKIQMKGGILHINGEPVKREYIGKFFVVNLPHSIRRSDSVTITTKDSQTLTVIGTKKLYLNGRPMQDDSYTIAYKKIDNFNGEAVELSKYQQTLPEGRRHLTVEISDSELMDDTIEYSVPEDHYFMMGDNRDMSEDSRFLDEVGYIHARDLIGRANIIFFSHNNSVRFFELWKILKPIRYERILKVIR
jgi:signal peptidase I